MYGSRRRARRPRPVAGVRGRSPSRSGACGSRTGAAAPASPTMPARLGAAPLRLRHREPRRCGGACWRLALERPGITLIAPARAGGACERGPTPWSLTLDDGRELAAPLVDRRRWPRLGGARARPASRSSAGAIRRPRSPSRCAMPQPHDGCVREYLRPAGPLALLPLGPEPVLGHLDREPRRSRRGCCVCDPTSLLRRCATRLGTISRRSRSAAGRPAIR